MFHTSANHRVPCNLEVLEVPTLGAIDRGLPDNCASGLDIDNPGPGAVDLRFCQ
ncbi:hypothetical protein K443DRAFT_10934 [Laccaria amethystina LaAM-08-1]|uniref:Uncharacterized protein n=1 Tax=Laccaria amethystina LaAM-08-1 TaxID=1095629 RepID=A0A0C9WUQ0_9AGAR|nr:hypothetical protein K443DRAFT_10934 [Laccaria amethystina LaAM-08-1]